MSSDDYLFVLVNGTWAGKTGRPPFPIFKPAEYMTEKHHILRLILTEKIQKENSNSKVTFINGWWHSRNSVQCRKDGAVKIAEEIRGFISKYEEKLPNIFLIAHSHGCDVCYRIMQEEDLSNKLNGLIAMNSPNMIELKRDFFKNFKSRKVWLNLSMISICIVYFLLLFVSMVSLKNTNPYLKFEDNIEQHLVHIIIIPTLIIFTFIITKAVKKFIEYIKNTPTDYKFKDTKHKILCTNSSGDEAWNILNLFSSFAQFPFFFTHPYLQIAIGGILALFFIIYPFYNPNITHDLVDSIPLFGELFKNIKIESLQNTNFLTPTITVITAVIILTTLAILSLFNLFIGYIFCLIYETIGVGTSLNFRNLKLLISKRTIVSMFPAHIRNIQFLESSDHSNISKPLAQTEKSTNPIVRIAKMINPFTYLGILAHSRPYTDEWTIERMAEWVSTGEAKLCTSRNSNREGENYEADQ